MTQRPEISIVIPVFNRPDSLRRSVKSVLAQDVAASLEVLIVDDASSVPVTWEDDRRVRIIRHPTNRGAAEARNTGMAEAAGEFVAFLDSDDVWEQGKLARQLDIMRAASPDLIGVFSRYVFEGSPDRPISAGKGIADWFAYFLDGCRVGPGSTLMFRQGYVDLIGRQDSQLPRFEDWDWLLRAARLGRFEVSDGPGAILSLSGRPSLETVLACAKRLETKWSPALSFRQGRQLRAALNIERAAASNWNRLRGRAFGYLARAVFCDPLVVARELGKRLP